MIVDRNPSVDNDDDYWPCLSPVATFNLLADPLLPTIHFNGNGSYQCTMRDSLLSLEHAVQCTEEGAEKEM